ncbi:MAG TPA: RNA pseudouridine synthase [Gammaproteobacteria bacterium]|nr:RNA pseudouridine synthase [Gammaproteobacteria bacterium]
MSSSRAPTDNACSPSGRVRQELAIRVPSPPPARLTNWLAEHTGLSHERIKDALAKGAVWHAPVGRRAERVRRVTRRLASGDVVSLYYDSEVLACKPPSPRLITSEHHYSVWEKPPGLLMEGSRFGDHATVERLVAQLTGRPVWLPHRLDRDAGGLILVAHTRDGAARLSALFRERIISKQYHAEVSGHPAAGIAAARVADTGERVIDSPLDDKPSRTRFHVLTHDAARDASVLRVAIETGRYHQIRRHLAGIGHPILGDPIHGGRPDPRGLRLRATALSFVDPWDGGERRYELAGLD